MTEEPIASDGEWVRAAVRQFEGPLVRYALRIVGDLECARDVVQETFLRLCRQDRQRVDHHLAEWLYTVCRNRALDVRRKERRMSQLSDAQVQMRPASEPGPAEVAEMKDSASRVLDLLAALPDNQRDVLRLKFQSGLSYREISGVTGLSISNVGFLIHTGLNSLRKSLAVAGPAGAHS